MYMYPTSNQPVSRIRKHFGQSTQKSPNPVLLRPHTNTGRGTVRHQGLIEETPDFQVRAAREKEDLQRRKPASLGSFLFLLIFFFLLVSFFEGSPSNASMPHSRQRSAASRRAHGRRGASSSAPPSSPPPSPSSPIPSPKDPGARGRRTTSPPKSGRTTCGTAHCPHPRERSLLSPGGFAHRAILVLLHWPSSVPAERRAAPLLFAHCGEASRPVPSQPLGPRAESSLSPPSSGASAFVLHGTTARDRKRGPHTLLLWLPIDPYGGCGGCGGCGADLCV